MAEAATHFRLGIAVVDTPSSALATIKALLDANLQIDQVCLIAIERVIDHCASLVGRLADGNSRLARLFDEVQPGPNPPGGESSGGEEIVSTSAQLFNAFLRTQLTPAGSIVRSQASRRSWNVERAIRDGAIAVVSRAKDLQQQQLATRILLANSTHSVTTFELPSVYDTTQDASGHR